MVRGRAQPTRSKRGYGSRSENGHLPIEEAILKTLAYADIFDYPLKPEEIHRYLVSIPASYGQVWEALENQAFSSHHIQSIDGYFMLKGRESSYEIRQKRNRLAAQMLPRAVHYGRMIASLPYTRMVAITGALAVSNVNQNADFDYFIVTQPGRVWLCRAFVILLVRLIARREGDVICPNYLLSENALRFTYHSLYTAHELAQMMPVAGFEIYQELRACNAWTEKFLPNAEGPPSTVSSVPMGILAPPLRRFTEGLLARKPGEWLETWEMQRKIRRFGAEGDASEEAAFCADWCKGHFEDHGRRTLSSYDQRIRALGLVPEAKSGDQYE